MQNLTFGSVCSGIEAASVAWNPLGWEADWFAEVDRAASEVLAHRFPEIPNLGDMTRLPAMVRSREIPAPDILVGGTPCQSFSVAGLRGGLSDPRGQLTIAFIDLADAIDEIRIADGKPAVIVVWENVPGVLSHADNPLGCFLAGLAGESDALVPAGRKWTNAGCVFGPQRTAAWRVQDAQYHGLAQRRRRLFVVAGARQGFDPAAVLLEFDGLRRDTAPSRETGQSVAGTLDARTHGGGFPGTDGACSGHVVPANTGGVLGAPDRGRECFGVPNSQPPGSRRPVRDDVRLSSAHEVVGSLDTECGFNKATMQSIYAGHVMPCIADTAPVPPRWDGREVSQTLDAVLHKGQTMPEKNRFPAVLQPVIPVCPTLRAGGNSTGGNRPPGTDADTADSLIPICFTSKDYGADAQEDLSPTLRAGGHTGSHANAGVPPAVVYSVALRGRDGGGTAELGDDLAGALRASSGGGDKPHVLVLGEPLPFDTTQITSPSNYSNPRAGDSCHPLAAGAHPPAVAICFTDTRGDNRGSGIQVTGEIANTPHCAKGQSEQQSAVYAIQERAICENPNAGPDGIGVRSDGAAYTLEARAVPQAVCVTGSVTHTLKAEGFDASEDGTGRGQPITVVHGTQDPCVSDIAFAQGRNNGGENVLLVPPQMAVRRLMPEECEALQGFPRNWTLVPTGRKRKSAADGPRYKQLGNSMAVPVITWIGRRIIAELDRSRGHNGGPPLECDPFDELLG